MGLGIEQVKRGAMEGMTSYLLMTNGAGEPICIPFDPADRKEKQLYIMAARQVAQMAECSEVWFVSEAWAAITDFESGIQDLEKERAKLPDNLEDAPSRIELLICQNERRGHQTRLWVFEIKRGNDDRITELVEQDGLTEITQNNVWILREPVAPVTH